MIRPRHALACLLTVVASPALADKPNRTVDSRRQPVVANGVATVPGCPDWSDARDNVSEATAPNYGCATNTNLAAMIADPHDLVHGREADGSTDGRVAVRSVKAWRDQEASGKAGLAQISAKGGN